MIPNLKNLPLTEVIISVDNSTVTKSSVAFLNRNCRLLIPETE